MYVFFVQLLYSNTFTKSFSMTVTILNEKFTSQLAFLLLTIQ